METAEKTKSLKIQRAILIAVSILLAAGIIALSAALSAGKTKTEVLYKSAEDGSSFSAGSVYGENITDAAASAAPSVTEIYIKTYSGGVITASGAGSGVIITSTGYIVTNNHVVEGSTQITVRLYGGSEYPASLIGTDKVTDLAVIKIEETGLKPAVFGNSDGLKVGQSVIAIGNPLGSLGGTVTNGIISAKERSVSIDGITMELLQTNAAINPGNSGGGLFNLSGELIGVVNAKTSGEDVEGLGFAIPSNTALNVASALMENGYVAGRVSSGLQVTEISNAFSLQAYGLRYAGVYVSAVTGENASEFSRMDYIKSIDGIVISSVADFNSVLYSHKVGDALSVSVVRNNSALVNLSLTLTEAKP